MANMFRSMPEVGDEGPRAAHKLVSRFPLFYAFTSMVVRLVADEANLVGLPEGEPAIDARITTAVASRTNTLAAFKALMLAEAEETHNGCHTDKSDVGALWADDINVNAIAA